LKTLNDVLMNEILERNARKSSRSTETVEQPVGLHETREKLIQCLAESTEGVFSTMCGWEMICGSRSSTEGFSSSHDISGIIGLSGAIKATIVVSISNELVFSAAEAILGQRPTSINADVVDLVGELANMIGGNAKERLSMPSVSLGLPTVVAGTGHFIAYNSRMAISMIPFVCEHGPLSIELGLV
jgi:chemotaxis protein CheX